VSEKRKILGKKEENEKRERMTSEKRRGKLWGMEIRGEGTGKGRDIKGK